MKLTERRWHQGRYGSPDGLRVEVKVLLIAYLQEACDTSVGALELQTLPFTDKNATGSYLSTLSSNMQHFFPFSITYRGIMELQEQIYEENSLMSSPREPTVSDPPANAARAKRSDRVPRYLDYKKALTAQNESRQELVTRIAGDLPPEIQGGIIKFLAAALLPSAANFHEFEEKSDFSIPEHIDAGRTIDRMARMVLETLGDVRRDNARTCRVPEKVYEFSDGRRAVSYDRGPATSPYRIEGVESLAARFNDQVHEAILHHVAVISPTPWISKQSSSSPPCSAHLGSDAKYIRKLHLHHTIPFTSEPRYPIELYLAHSNIAKLKEWLPRLQEFRFAVFEHQDPPQVRGAYFARSWKQEVISIAELLVTMVLEMRKLHNVSRSLGYYHDEQAEERWTKASIADTRRIINGTEDDEDTIVRALISLPGHDIAV